MQKTSRGTTPATARTYHERLTPSLWTIGAAAVVAPMVALVLAPFDRALGLPIGIAVAVGLVALLIATSPQVEVAGGELRAGRAHIPVGLLGSAEIMVGEQARQGRGPGLRRDAWHLIRGGVDGLVRITVTDPDDPTPEWVISSRTPDRLAAAIRRAQLRS
ncbi:DUF3093 domain-containing protein [Microbacterium terrisoli]|uniref:DUF3093 domain-containing protein n=1 Tax=Microbacterium terrisoli TaxID=3242192 RepID=UPI0028056250|nr:DUF3093 domain-containing protein [Microbacterium protaetiae]